MEASLCAQTSDSADIDDDWLAIGYVFRETASPSPNSFNETQEDLNAEFVNSPTDNQFSNPGADTWHQLQNLDIPYDSAGHNHNVHSSIPAIEPSSNVWLVPADMSDSDLPIFEQETCNKNHDTTIGISSGSDKLSERTSLTSPSGQYANLTTFPSSTDKAASMEINPLPSFMLSPSSSDSQQTQIPQNIPETSHSFPKEMSLTPPRPASTTITPPPTTAETVQPQVELSKKAKTKSTRSRKRRQPVAASNHDKTDDAPMLPPCRICQQKASGFHYGANTCEGCKGFFRRALQTHNSFKCVASGDCNVTGVNRKLCASCRYRKCLEVGMSREAIKIGRYSCEMRTKNILEVKQAKTEKYLQNSNAPVNSSNSSRSSIITNESAQTPYQWITKSEGFDGCAELSNSPVSGHNTKQNVPFELSNGSIISDSVTLDIPQTSTPYQNISSPISYHGSIMAEHNAPITDYSYVDESESVLSAMRPDSMNYFTPLSDFFVDQLVDSESLISNQNDVPETETNVLANINVFCHEPDDQNTSLVEFCTLHSESTLCSTPTTHDATPTTHDVTPTTHDVTPTTHDVTPTTHDVLSSESSISDLNNPSFESLQRCPGMSITEVSQIEPKRRRTEIDFKDIVKLYRRWSLKLRSKDEALLIDKAIINNNPESFSSCLSPSEIDDIDSGIRQDLEKQLEMILDGQNLSLNDDTLITRVEWLEKYQRLNAAHHERLLRPLSHGGATMLDNIIHQLVVEHNKNMLVSTYMPETFILKRQKSFLEDFRLREELLGEVKPMAIEEYVEMSRKTGVDFDGRLSIIKEHLRSMERYIKRLIRFARSIPGFKDLDLDDKVLMIKKSSRFINFLGIFKGFNSDLDCVLFPNGRCIHKRMMQNLSTGCMTNTVFKTAESLKKEVWVPEELIILKALLFTMINTNELQNPGSVESVQHLLLTCLGHALRKFNPDSDPEELVGHTLSKLRVVRNLNTLDSQTFINKHYKDLCGNLPLLKEVFDH